VLRAAIITLRIGLCDHFSDFAKIMAYNRTRKAQTMKPTSP
jgi:hypothetical protein